jgi:hypothetical protein
MVGEWGVGRGRGGIPLAGTEAASSAVARERAEVASGGREVRTMEAERGRGRGGA